MLARTFKTAVELGLTPRQHDALVGVLGMFERGEITDRHFAMDKWWETGCDAHDRRGRFCGTIGCIGGWAGVVGKDENLFVTLELRDRPLSAMAQLQNLHDLFYPEASYAVDYYWEDITVAQATQALRNYLTTGEPQWGEVLSAEACVNAELTFTLG